MSEQILQILDQSLTYSLWAFLLIFIIILFFIALRLKARKRGLADYFREEFEKRFEREIVGEDLAKPLERYVPLSNRLRMAVHALFISAVLALGCFLVAGFTPISFFDNFATEKRWQTTPLRLTRLNYERFYEGFSLQGQVWNQSEQSIRGLRAIIHIWKFDHELLDQVLAPVQPDPFPSRSAGTFSVRYTENSPFLYGYQVSFERADGLEVPHVKGF
ncbi:hypothetical protein MYX84_04860, partial [Acidobacteria bacterium AH-259-O06]|nr:hypothetical protein [Acidobacteria bacterium AH-259-O06]